MATLTNKDLFFFLKNLDSTITYKEQLFDFVVERLNINSLESGNSEKIKKYLRSFCANVSTPRSNQVERYNILQNIIICGSIKNFKFQTV